MKRIIGALLPLLFCGCSTLKILEGEARQPATRVPLYVYRADLIITVDGVQFDGVGVTSLAELTDIDILSQVTLDRVEVETDGRQDVCESGKVCDENKFTIDKGWWGRPGNHMVYHYRPSVVESDKKAPSSIYFRVYSKRDLAAWGFLALRRGEDLPGRIICNGDSISFKGHSVCQTKFGKTQRLIFTASVDEHEADPSCHLITIDAQTFEMRPDVDLCTADFFTGGHWHKLDLIGYEQSLVAP